MKGLIGFTFACTAALLPEVARPQDAPPALTFIQVIEAQCPGMTAKLMSGAVFSDALSGRELDKALACTCAVDKLRANPKLAPYLDANAEELRAKLPRKQQGSMLMTYGMSAVIGCIATQLDAALDAASLDGA